MSERYYDKRFPIFSDTCILQGRVIIVHKYQIIYGITHILIDNKYDIVSDLTELTPAEIRFISDKAVTDSNKRFPLTEIGKPLELFRQTNESYIMDDIQSYKDGRIPYIKNKTYEKKGCTFYNYRTDDSNNYIIKFKPVGKDGKDGLSNFTCISGPLSDDVLFRNMS